ncbi:hypothetical protein JMJ77_0007855, partial [Colletotrichum scovillei]
ETRFSQVSLFVLYKLRYAKGQRERGEKGTSLTHGRPPPPLKLRRAELQHDMSFWDGRTHEYSEKTTKHDSRTLLEFKVASLDTSFHRHILSHPTYA